MKTCTKCRATKPYSDFSRSKPTRDGYHAWCKLCLSVISKVCYEKDFKHRRAYAKGHREKLKEQVLELYGRKCKHCGFADERALVVDHVNGDGYLDLQPGGSRRGGAASYKRVLENPERFQLLCANCNLIKAIEDKEFVGPPTKYHNPIESIGEIDDVVGKYQPS
jgi:hypothetical protein